MRQPERRMALSQGRTGTKSKREGKRSWLMARYMHSLTCLHPKPLKPIVESILCVAFLAMLSWHTVGQSLDPHWSTAWLWGWAGLLWLAARNGIRLVSVKAWALGLGVLAASFACGLQQSPESLLIHDVLTVLWTLPAGCSWLNAMGRVAPWSPHPCCWCCWLCPVQGLSMVGATGKLPIAVAVGAPERGV